MKTSKIYIKILGLGILLSLVSCDKFLNRYPYNENSSESMFQSATLAESVVIGVYSNLLYDYNTTEPSVLNWDAISSVLDPQEGGASLHFSYLFGTVQASNSMFSQYWKRFYEGVNRANDVIENISKVPDMLDAIKSKRIAECRFLRAYNYYRLNSLWRGVPIYEKNLAPTEYVRGRSSEEDVWQFIIDDCTACIECEQIPDIYLSGNNDYGRVSRGAAYMLRGKAYMWLKDYKKAEADFLSVGECGYELFKGSYADLFLEKNEKCKEMIFSVQMVEEKDNGNAYSNNYGNYCTTGYGKYYYYLNTDFVDSYQNKDGSPFDWNDVIPGFNEMDVKARKVFFLRNNLSDSEKTSMSSKSADMSKYLDGGNEARIKAAYENRDPRLSAVAITPYSTYNGGASGSVVTYTSRYPYRDWQAPSLDLRYGNNEYMFYPIRKFVTSGRDYLNIGYNPVDMPIFRYAETLLCLAEALNEQGKTTEAISYLNQVRQRAGVALLNNGSSFLKVDSQENMRQRIRQEKRWELACEQQIYLEELRWGDWKNTKFAAGNGLKNVWGEPMYEYIWGGNAYNKWAVPQMEVEKAGLAQNEYWN